MFCYIHVTYAQIYSQGDRIAGSWHRRFVFNFGVLIIKDNKEILMTCIFLGSQFQETFCFLAEIDQYLLEANLDLMTILHAITGIPIAYN